MFITADTNQQPMTKRIPAKCPSCGANLEFPEDMDVGHCMHCGGKVFASGPEVVHHHYEGSDFNKLEYNRDVMVNEIASINAIIYDIDDTIKEVEKKARYKLIALIPSVLVFILFLTFLSYAYDDNFDISYGQWCCLSTLLILAPILAAKALSLNKDEIPLLRKEKDELQEQRRQKTMKRDELEKKMRDV